MSYADRFRDKRLAQRRLEPKPDVMPRDKGQFMGACNMSACLKPGANWYNHGSLAYYCEGCAYRLNYDRFNRQESQRLWGTGALMCTEGKYDGPMREYIN